MRARTPSKVLAAASIRRSTPSIAVRYQSSDSTPSSSTWQPVLPRGAMPVYDAALDYLASHRAKCDEKIKQLSGQPNLTAEQRAELDGLEVDGYVNDPATRAEFRKTKGAGQMGRAVMRHLAERRWKKEGGLDLIMGRVYQNKVVPDVIPDVAPLNPLTLTTDEGIVEPGLTIDCRLVDKAPRLHYQAFQHPALPSADTPHPTALYTLVAIDADSPDTVEYSFTERLHYLKTDIPLSVVSDQTDLIRSAPGNELVSWEPLAPGRGSQRHRLVFILLRQLSNKPSELTTAPLRENFSVRGLMASLKLPLNAIVGVNLIKSEWTEESDAHIKQVWGRYRGQKAPVYKPVDWETRYAKPLTPVQKRAEALQERAFNRNLDELQRDLLADMEEGTALTPEQTEELLESLADEEAVSANEGTASQSTGQVAETETESLEETSKSSGSKKSD